MPTGETLTRQLLSVIHVLQVAELVQQNLTVAAQDAGEISFWVAKTIWGWFTNRFTCVSHDADWSDDHDHDFITVRSISYEKTGQCGAHVVVAMRLRRCRNLCNNSSSFCVSFILSARLTRSIIGTHGLSGEWNQTTTTHHYHNNIFRYSQYTLYTCPFKFNLQLFNHLFLKYWYMLIHIDWYVQYWPFPTCCQGTAIWVPWETKSVCGSLATITAAKRVEICQWKFLKIYHFNSSFNVYTAVVAKHTTWHGCHCQPKTCEKISKYRLHQHIKIILTYQWVWISSRINANQVWQFMWTCVKSKHSLAGKSGRWRPVITRARIETQSKLKHVKTGPVGNPAVRSCPFKHSWLFKQGFLFYIMSRRTILFIDVSAFWPETLHVTSPNVGLTFLGKYKQTKSPLAKPQLYSLCV